MSALASLHIFERVWEVTGGVIHAAQAADPDKGDVTKMGAVAVFS